MLTIMVTKIFTFLSTHPVENRNYPGVAFKTN